MAGKKGTPAELRALVDELEVLEKRKRERAVDFYKPYPKQQAFHDAGSEYRERLLMAGNQLGKTFCGAAEVAYHLTGEYPDWWKGRRWDRPVKWWVGGVTGLGVRDTAQKLLFGEPGVETAVGTGSVPKAAILDRSLARGVDALYDTVQVKHRSGGTSICRLKTYDQGRAKWQGETLDGIWFDEEPPLDLYSEGLTRITATKGIVFMTFTPLQGMSDVVIRYLQEASKDRSVTNMTIDDALHIPPEERQRIIDGYPAHEREARVKGIPMLGSGRIFTTPEESMLIQKPDPLPAHWVYLWGIDFGIDHPFAAVLMGWDRDADVLHVLHTIRLKGMRPIDHAAAIKPFGNIPVAWPQDGTARESNGEQLSYQYKKEGLPMMPQHATFKEGGLSTEAGVMEMNTRMSTGKWKVAAHLSDWFEEYRLYHRKDGLIVKERDDLLSASRVGMMMRRYARQLPHLLPWQLRQRVQEVASDVDFEVT